ncbi:IS3 family transposase [Escherichia coli]
MSRKGNCLDNAVVECFFWNLKVGVFFYLDEFSNISELKDAVTEYIEYYNSRRISLKLKGLTQLNIGIRPICLVFNCPTFWGQYKL